MRRGVLAEHSLWVARRRHRKVNAQKPGKAENESAPEWEAPDSPRATESPGQRRVSCLAYPCRQALLRVSAPLPIRGRRVWEEFPGRLLLTRQRQPPCGASGLVGAPTPDDPRSYSITLSTHPLNQEIRAAVGAPARTGGRSRARGACGEGACDRCARPPVRRTLAPPFGLVTGPFLPTMRGRRPASYAPRQRGACCIALMRHT